MTSKSSLKMKGGFILKKEGKVIETFDKKARVLIKKKSVCSKCEKDCDLAKDHESGEVVIEVNNKLGVRSDQKVKVEMKESSVVSAALIIYAFPLLAAITGYFFGDWMSGRFNLFINQGEMMGIIGTLLFLVISFLIIKVLNSRFEAQSKYEPVITEIIYSNSTEKTVD